MNVTTADPLRLRAICSRCSSVTPAEGGALGLIEGSSNRSASTFIASPLPSGHGAVENLYAASATPAASRFRRPHDVCRQAEQAK